MSDPGNVASIGIVESCCRTIAACFDDCYGVVRRSSCD